MSRATTNQASNQTGKQATRVAIIGGGLAGVTCALELQKLGAQVTLFEKSRGVSGRMSTRRGQLAANNAAQTADHPWQCDHGAQYFVATAPSFQAQVSLWQSQGLAQPWQPRIALLDGFGRPATAAALTMPGGETAFDHRQAMAIERWVGAPRMTSIVSEIATALREQVRLEETVNALNCSTQSWQLSTVEHGAIDASFDAVVLAVPAPQAAALLQTVGGVHPTLDVLGAAVASQAMQACWTVMISLNQALKLDFDAAVIDSGPLKWIALDNTKPGRPAVSTWASTWALHASADWSAANIEATADFVLAELVSAFARVVKSAVAPVQASAHRWRYATALARAEQDGAEQRPQCHWQRETGLGLCGDWLAGGTVEAAWLSASRLARLMQRDLPELASAAPRGPSASR